MKKINKKKVVINACFGGYSISALATTLLAEKKGRECYFFEHSMDANKYKPIALKDTDKVFIWHAFSVPNPQDYRLNERDEDGLFGGANERSAEISLSSISERRDDPDLVSVIEKIGVKANGKFAELKIVEIPADVEWEIEEYDGFEHIAEKHRTWGN